MLNGQGVAMTTSDILPARKGFTLVELLTVVAIIAVLMAVLLPALNKAREAGKTVACLSNLKQLGYVMHMYAGDNRGYLPGAYNMSTSKNPDGTPAPDWCFLNTVAKQYVGAVPTANRNSTFRCAADEAYKYRGAYWTSYGVNTTYTEGNLLGVMYPPARIDDTASPTGTAIMGGNYGHGTWNIPYRSDIPSSPSGYSSASSFRHNVQTNVVFLDGHVETRSPDKVPTPAPPNDPFQYSYVQRLNTVFCRGSLSPSHDTIPGL